MDLTDDAGVRPTGWGGAPVPVHAVRAQVRAAATAACPTLLPAAKSAGALVDLFGTRSATRRRRVAGLLAGGLSAASGGRRVLVGALTGGAGVSTLAALLWQAWSARGVPGVLLDGAGGWRPGLPDRIDPTALFASPRWLDFAGRDTAVLVKEFDAVRSAASAGTSLLVTGGPRAAQVAPADAAMVAGAAVTSWPLVVTDPGSGDARLWTQLAAGRVDLLLLVCRRSVAELRDAADYLRAATAAGLIDGPARAVVATVGAEPDWSRQVSAAVAAVADTAAGAIGVPAVAALHDRAVCVTRRHLGPAVDLIASAVAAVSSRIEGESL